jgi:hypothetical protein
LNVILDKPQNSLFSCNGDSRLEAAADQFDCN